MDTLRTYDLAFGLGTACSCSQTLRGAGLQYLSFPMDWTACAWGTPIPQDSFVQEATWICKGLDGFLCPNDLRFIGPHEWNGKDIYGNARTHFVFNHDFPAGGDFATELPKVVAKYQRRYARLVSLIRASRRVLVVHIDFPNRFLPTPHEDCRRVREQLSATFPNVTFETLLLQCDPTIPFEKRQWATTGEGCHLLTFDYRNRAPDADPQIPDLALTGAAVQAFARVRDYRTHAEKKAYRRQKNLKHWAKVGATTRWGYYKTKVLAALGIVKPASCGKV